MNSLTTYTLYLLNRAGLYDLLDYLDLDDPLICSSIKSSMLSLEIVDFDLLVLIFLWSCNIVVNLSD